MGLSDEEDFNSYSIEDRLEMTARVSAASMFVCKLMDEAAQKIKELQKELNVFRSREDT